MSHADTPTTAPTAEPIATVIAPRRTRARATIALVAALAMAGLPACSSGGTSSDRASGAPAETASGHRIDLTDQAGRQVSVPAPAQRIVCLEHHALDTIAMLGGQKRVVGVVDKWKSLLGDYMTQVFPGIASLPTPGGLEDANVEAVAALKPDVVIVAPQFDKGKIEKLTQLGIPVVVIAFRAGGAQKEAQNPVLADADKAYTDGTHWAVDTLGALTDTAEKAKKLWATTISNRAYVEKKLAGIPEDKRVRVFIANEKNMTYGTGKYVTTQLTRAGATNVAYPTVKGYAEVGVEQVATWNPDVILVQDRYKSVYDQIRSDAKWKNIAAVKSGRVYLAPSWTKIWGNPAPDSIALGEMWLASTFYPDRVPKSEVEKQVKAFYQDYYGVPFTGSL